jgi:palmitoyltransferase
MWSSSVLVVRRPCHTCGAVGLRILTRSVVDYFLRSQRRPGVAAAFLVVYFIFFVLMIVSYARLFVLVQFNPDVVPLGPKVSLEWRAKVERDAARARSRRSRRSKDPDGDLEAQRYVPEPPDSDPDSPGLERFYTKDVFVCEPDGRPRWCVNCANWKEDRTYHNGEINRCVRKLDHYCPWVGGNVSQSCELRSFHHFGVATNDDSAFKFFIQFTFYTMLYCVVCLAATCMRLRDLARNGESVDGVVVAITAIAGLFGFFTFMMATTSARYALVNLTTVEVLKQRSTVRQLALQVPRGTPPTMNYGVVTYPLPKPGSQDVSTSHLSGQTAVTESQSSRDLLATRTFAIVKTELGDNPWDLGYYRNWKTVMGNNPIDWLLPIRRSPCVTYERNSSFYEMGPLVKGLRERYGLPAPGVPGSKETSTATENGVEMTQVRAPQSGMVSGAP